MIIVQSAQAQSLRSLGPGMDVRAEKILTEMTDFHLFIVQARFVELP